MLFDLLFADSNETLPGCGASLLKTLPVKLPIDGSATIDSLLRDTHEQIGLAADGPQHAGEALRIHESPETTMFAFVGEGPAIDFDAILSSSRAALVTSAGVQEGMLVLQGAYRTDCYCEAFVTEFLKCMGQILSELPHKEKLEQIDLMYEGAFEPYDLVNQTEVPVEIMSVNKLFERQVALHPDKTAVIAAGESLTFDQLNRLANRAAHGLHALGIGKDNIVGMVLDRTKEIFIAEHAILKAGGAFLPMVPEYPDERITYCLDDAESPCVITTEAIKAGRPELFSESHAYKTLTVEELIRNDGEENLDLAIETDGLAYCIYTSGSTGKPKGVMIEHHNMCNYLNANPMHPAIYWHTQNIDTALSVTSISFDMSITERFVSLCNGITLCMATLDEIHNPVALAKLMTEHHTESIVCTPSYLMSLLEIPQARKAITALKAFHVGGEAFPTTLIARLKELNPDSHVMNGYGPTETSVCCTSSEILPEQPVTIGRPEANVTHYVMDKSLRPMPAGACGELFICGAGVGRGYVKLPERTAASFFTFRDQPAYHSGDLVRLNANGEYDYYGKIDKKQLPDIRDAFEEREYVAPESAMEERFCAYFATVLKLERVGATDNFFEIGGTSLSAAMVVSKAMSDNLDVVYKNVFDFPTPRALAEFVSDEHIDVIINCAALVKHFETGNLIHKINYEGVVNLIDYALQTKARLVQISTLSIAGFIEISREADAILRETDYDLGQTLTIKYIAAKYEAEGAILDAIQHRGLRGKIIRIGNQTSRLNDGEFQINFRTNGFVNRLRAYELIGCFPVSLMDMPLEFSPVDMTAKAVVLLAGTPDSFTVFHANNCHDIHFANVLEAFNRFGYHIDVVDDETFQQRFREALADEKKSIAVSSLASYDGNANEALVWTRWDNSYTVKVLYRLGFSWPLISPEYLNNHLEMLASLDFFDEEGVQ